MSQNRTVVSPDPLARWRLSGLNCTDNTASECPVMTNKWQMYQHKVFSNVDIYFTPKKITQMGVSTKIMREGMALTGYAGRTTCDRFNAKDCLWLIYNLQYLLHRDCNKPEKLKSFSNTKIIPRKLLDKARNHVGIAKLCSLEQ